MTAKTHCDPGTVCRFCDKLKTPLNGVTGSICVTNEHAEIQQQTCTTAQNIVIRSFNKNNICYKETDVVTTNQPCSTTLFPVTHCNRFCRVQRHKANSICWCLACSGALSVFRRCCIFNFAQICFFCWDTSVICPKKHENDFNNYWQKKIRRKQIFDLTGCWPIAGQPNKPLRCAKPV